MAAAIGQIGTRLALTTTFPTVQHHVADTLAIVGEIAAAAYTATAVAAPHADADPNTAPNSAPTHLHFHSHPATPDLYSPATDSNGDGATPAYPSCFPTRPGTGSSNAAGAGGKGYLERQTPLPLESKFCSGARLCL
ncbi:MAG: hypothetical protein R3E79_54370 [Caldilineaceae bacterium]